MSLDNYIPAKIEDNVLDGLYNYTNTINKLNNNIAFDEQKNAELASRLGNIYRIAPNLQPGITLALAKSNADDAFIARVAQASLYLEAQQAKEAEELRKKNKSFFERNIFDKVKTATRWTVAAGQLPFDIANEFSGRLLLSPTAGGDQMKFDPKNPFGKGWWASTAFGTMMKDDERSGSGWFLGGDAEAGRQQRLMDYAGSIPLTVEAGASTATAYQPDPEDIRQLAVQISAEKGITFDEALTEAETLIRQNARAPFAFQTMFPLAVGEVAGVASKVLPFTSAASLADKMKPIEFKYEDIGSTGYNTAAVLGSLGLALVAPDPVSMTVKGIAKPLWRYARGVGKVDKAGNFIVDYTHAAQTTGEAEFLAQIDSLNVAVNKFEAMGLSAEDAAVETLSPKPGVWYHGSTGGRIEKFADIEDPAMPSASTNLYGPGVYTSESPTITQTVGYQPPSSTAALTTEEIDLLKGLNLDINLDVVRSLTEAEIETLRRNAAFGGGTSRAFVRPNNIGTVYRFVQRADIEPNMLDVEMAMPLEQATALAESLVSSSGFAENFALMLEQHPIQGLSDLIGLGASEDIVQTIGRKMSDGLVSKLVDEGVEPGSATSDIWHRLRDWKTDGFGDIRDIVLRRFAQTSYDINNNALSPLDAAITVRKTPQLATQMIVFKLAQYVAENGALPETLDELTELFGGAQGLRKLVSEPMTLGEYAQARAAHYAIVGDYKVNHILASLDTGVLDRIPDNDPFMTQLTKTTAFKTSSHTAFFDRINGSVKQAVIDHRGKTQMFKDYETFVGLVQDMFPGLEIDANTFTALDDLFASERPLRLNQMLHAAGYDGITHTGGRRWGGGGFLHRVSVWFDPVKNLDITDPLTGEATPVNSALRNLVESKQYFDEAGNLRTEMDSLRAAHEAGVIPGTTNVDPEKFKSYFAASRQGRFAVDQVWKTVSSDSETKWYDLWKMFDGRLPLDVLREMLSAPTRGALLEVLNSKAGWTPGLANLDDLNFSLSKVATRFKQASRVDKLMDGIEELGGKFWHRSPETTLLFIGGSDAQKMQALRDLEAWLITGQRVEPNKVKKLVQDLGLAMTEDSKTATFEATRSISRAIYEKMLAATGDKAYAKNASNIFDKAVEDSMGGGTYSVSAEGLRTDNNYAATLGSAVSRSGTHSVKLEEMVHGGPGLLSELINTPLELPDVLQTRRAVSFIGYFTGKQGMQRALRKTELLKHVDEVFGVKLSAKELEKLGELRLPLRAVEFLMTKTWKTLKKFSAAYAVRNTMEAQARMATTDRISMFTHPIDYILTAMHWKVPDDILLGEAYNPVGWSGLGKAFENSSEEYQRFLNAGHFGTEARMDLVKSQYRNGSFGVFPKDFNNGVSWAKAGAYELRQLAADPIAKMLARGAKVEDVMTWLYSGSPEAQKALGKIEDLMRNGELFYPKEGFAPPEIVPVDPTRANVEARIRAQQEARLSLKTGNDPNLLEVVHSGTIEGKPAWKPNGDPTVELRDYLLNNINNPELPRFYKGRGESTKWRTVQTAWYTQASRFFFDKLVGWEYNALDRSPLWRTEYSKEVMRLAPLLSPDEAAKLMNQIERRVAHYAGIAQNSKTLKRVAARDFDLQDYLGAGVDADEFRSVLGTARGTLSLEDLHIYANSLTLNKLEKLLFDAAARNSITDAARIVSPFGAAWAEVWKKMVPLLAKNPDKVERVMRTFQTVSGENAPEGLKVNGILHKDPITGDYMYSLPLSGTIASLMIKAVDLLPGVDTRQTGSRFSFEAPVQGLNMAFNVVPGFSPVVGFPLGKLMFGSPKLRDIAQFLMPYGQPKNPFDPTQYQEYLPGWASKIISALSADPKRDALYGDVLADVIRVEQATGKWDLSNSEQRKQFFADAEAKAKTLTIMRGIGQFLGPASPQLTARVRTEMGDVFTGFLTAEFHKFQSENYENAVARFINMYGEDTFMYMAGKTREVNGGIEASKEFADWELKNGDLFDEYPEVAGYFGPKGSNFDWAAWQYQVNTGKRERVMPIPDQVNEAEKIIGLATYRGLVKVAGPNPNDQQKALLQKEKTRLENEYPGMLTLTSYDVTKFDRQLKLLRKAANDPLLEQNETAIALRQYLSYRDQIKTALDQANIGFKSKQADSLRSTVLYYGTVLVDFYPEFGRVFDRILVQEVSD